MSVTKYGKDEFKRLIHAVVRLDQLTAVNYQLKQLLKTSAMLQTMKLSGFDNNTTNATIRAIAEQLPDFIYRLLAAGYRVEITLQNGRGKYNFVCETLDTVNGFQITSLFKNNVPIDTIICSFNP